MAIKYEWCWETLDEHGDIIDSNSSEKLEPGEGRLVLVRSEGDGIDGLQDRLWAYVDAGKLPECFSDCNGAITGCKVPEKYVTEFKKSI